LCAARTNDQVGCRADHGGLELELNAMPDRNQLRVGDAIRLLSVPNCDLARREREIAAGIIERDSTATVIERIIATNPVVKIERIDEFGAAWFEVEFEESDGIHYHSLTILDDESWERIGK